jgi:hypothetical protein
MRIWFSGPRILGGLIRPGFSISSAEIARAFKKPIRAAQTEPEPWRIEHDRILAMQDSKEVVRALPRHTFWISWLILVLAIIGFFALVGCAITAAHAGMCWIYSDGTDGVTACQDGSYSVTDSHGRRRQYRIPNGGFERFPG